MQAGIPDFRSSEGLFQTLKRDNPRESLTSGKDLFDASVFNVSSHSLFITTFCVSRVFTFLRMFIRSINCHIPQSEHTTSLFCQMIAQLSELSQAALPTPFHQILRSLDERGKLLRVYTQNIDAIELKSGLSFGVPEFDARRKPRSKGKCSTSSDELATPTQTRLPSPPDETPRCIPLHGTLQTLHCQTCTHTVPLEDHLPSLSSGTPPYCPECTVMEETRQLVGKRARGVGKLRPSVVLYNEAHKDGEGVGEVVRKDLVGGSKGKGRSGADLLLVVGTSLRVPGTKRIVREFSKAVRSRGNASGLATPSPSPQQTPTLDEDSSPKAIYLNLDFPAPTREWEGVFDAWIQGDAQSFAEILEKEIKKESRAKEAASDRKRKREGDILAAQDAARSVKKRKITILPPTPPPSYKRKGKIVISKVMLKTLSSRKQHSPRSRPHSSPRRRLVPEVYIANRPPKPAPLDRDEDLAKDFTGRWIRGPLVLPGHSEVPPVVDEVDDYRSFKMFDAGWILPENTKRAGRGAVQRTSLQPKRRAGPAQASMTVAENFAEQADELPLTYLRTG